MKFKDLVRGRMKGVMKESTVRPPLAHTDAENQTL